MLKANRILSGYKMSKVYSIYRKDFSVNKDVISAALSVTARGVYEVTLNGQRVGNFIMASGRHIF